MKQLVEIFPGVFRMGGRLFTRSLLPGDKAFAKSVAKVGGEEYREWDPFRSKAAAAITKGLKEFPLRKASKVLYLGISSGSTASFFSDILGPEGIIYGVEISGRSMRDLAPVAEMRRNIISILANAKMPEEYGWVERVDVLYQDVATNDQSEILVRNAKAFLKKDGFAMMAIKARSIDVTRNPGDVFREEVKKLGSHFRILEKVGLEPYEKDHMFVLMKPR